MEIGARPNVGTGIGKYFKEIRHSFGVKERIQWILPERVFLGSKNLIIGT